MKILEYLQSSFIHLIVLKGDHVEIAQNIKSVSSLARLIFSAPCLVGGNKLFMIYDGSRNTSEP